jgi:hypothetical protein
MPVSIGVDVYAYVQACIHMQAFQSLMELCWSKLMPLTSNQNLVKVGLKQTDPYLKLS